MARPQKIVFLHLSDIHFRKVGGAGGVEAIDQDIRDQLLRDCDRILPEVGGKVHLIIISGDLAFSGRTDEFDRARAWLTALQGKVGCEPDAIRMVCGNHDVDRAIAKSSQTVRDIQQKFREEPVTKVNEYIKQTVEDQFGGGAAFAPIGAYNRFAESPYQSHFTSQRPYWEHNVVLNDHTLLKLRGLNSALASNDEDEEEHKKLVVGNGFCVLTEAEGVEHMAICHHPPSWLRDHTAVETYLNRRARIQLFGHLHEPKIINGDEHGFQYLRLHAGAVNPAGSELGTRPCYNWVTVEVAQSGKTRKMKLEVFPRIWSRENVVFEEDMTLTEGKLKRPYSLALPDQKLDSEVAKQAVVATVPLEPLNSLSDPLDILSGTDTHAKRLVDLRRFAFMFLSIPYNAQVTVAMDLGLLNDEDRAASPTELFRRLFTRAEEKQVTARFWELVNKHQSPQRPEPNPFD